MLLKDLYKRGVINPDLHIIDNTMFLATCGSEAYGVSKDTSDKDIKGFFIPRKSILFPHLEGKIAMFDFPNESTLAKHHIWEKHHVHDNGNVYDFRLDSIVKFIRLASDCNPDIIDMLFSPIEMIRHITEVGKMVYDNRHIFLSKKCWPTFRGYAFSNLHKSKHEDIQVDLSNLLKFEDEHKIKRSTKFSEISSLELDEHLKTTYKNMFSLGLEKTKRFEDIKINGFSTKHYYHVVRLLHEVDQIMNKHDLDIRECREHLKSIRRGEIKESDIISWVNEKLRLLEGVYSATTLREYPDHKQIKSLLINCLEHHYGSLDSAIVKDINIERETLLKIKEMIEKVV